MLSASVASRWVCRPEELLEWNQMAGIGRRFAVSRGPDAAGSMPQDLYGRHSCHESSVQRVNSLLPGVQDEYESGVGGEHVWV